VSTDFSTDGRYCFIMFKVEPIPSLCRSSVESDEVDWVFLRQTLTSICPADTQGALYFKPKLQSRYTKSRYYCVLTIKCKDRQGLIHWLICTFWRFKMTIHRLNCITTDEGDISDEFYISDIRPEGEPDTLPALILYISKNLDATVSTKKIDNEYDGSIRRTRLLSICEDADRRASYSGLLELVEPLLTSPSKNIDLAHASNVSPASETGSKVPGVSVEVDNSTSSENTILRCLSPDRKGVLYDFFRLLSDVSLKASYGRIATSQSSNSVCEALLFVKDSKSGGQIRNKEVQEKLKELIYSAIAKPFQLYLSPSPKVDCMELKVVAPVDSSGRGRPKVLYDVSAALNALKVQIFEAEMYVTGSLQEINQREVHIFHIKTEGNAEIGDDLQDKISESVFCQLMGIIKTNKDSFLSCYPSRQGMLRKKRRRFARMCCSLWSGSFFYKKT
jgi:hypothetical protein